MILARGGENVDEQIENHTLSEVVEECDKTIIRFGKTEIVQTADWITIQCR